MRKPKALLIDLDDTLIAYDGYATSAWTEACEEILPRATTGGLPVEMLVEEILRGAAWYFSDPERHRIGRNSLEETRREIVRNALKAIGRPDDVLADDIGNSYSRIRDTKLHMFPGAREALETLKEDGMPMCLVTNGEAHLQRRKIDRFSLEPYFNGILVEGELGFGKPDERVFMTALDILGVAAADAWIVGDNYEWEVVAPGKLGFTCVWVDKRGTGIPEQVDGVDAARPDAVISTFAEIMDLIDAAEPSR